MCCQQDGDGRHKPDSKKPSSAMENACLIYLRASAVQVQVMALCTGVKIILADQETVAIGAGRGRDLVPKGEMKNISTAASWSKIPGQLKSPESDSQDIPSNSLLLST